MLFRAVLIWCEILALAIANGAAREALLVPRFGDTIAPLISTIVLSMLVVVAGSLAMPWIGPGSAGDAWAIGGLWVALTLGFEFLAGHFIFGKPWKQLLADYNLAAGRIWLLVLVVTLVTPIVAFNRSRTATASDGARVSQHR